MRSLAPRLAEIPGVVAVTLGGAGDEDPPPDSDWDFGLYYRGTSTPTTCARSASRGRCSLPASGAGSSTAAHGSRSTGSPWISSTGTSTRCCRGPPRRSRVASRSSAKLATSPASRPMSSPASSRSTRCCSASCLDRRSPRACGRPRRRCGSGLQPERWRSDGRTPIAGDRNRGGCQLHAGRPRRRPRAGSPLRANWALNEKRIVERAGLSEAQAILAGVGVDGAAATLSSLLDLPSWR